MEVLKEGTRVSKKIDIKRANTDYQTPNTARQIRKALGISEKEANKILKKYEKQKNKFSKTDRTYVDFSDLEKVWKEIEEKYKKDDMQKAIEFAETWCKEHKWKISVPKLAEALEEYRKRYQ
jgi:hypothetical protein